ncbi:MAG TPA: hypothetical protein VMZ52_04465 [Bryobacteraceae bacterium]|nr:hypothetical protein [Bryobacteraceae bacterium]
MPRNVATLIIALAAAALGMQAADNTLGTWKRNIEKTTSTPAPKNPVTSLTVVREASDGGVKVTSTGQMQDGTAINSSYTAKYDGTESPVTGAPWDSISIKQVDANTLTSETKKSSGKYQATSRTVVSEDGKIMTVTSKGTNDEGESFSSTIVYDKQ